MSTTMEDVKLAICLVAVGFWIYFRDMQCYKLLKKGDVGAVTLALLWTYAVLQWICFFYRQDC